ncbi:MAG: hypothetical protein CMJ28_02995 [Phycisphaerae bacterium]|nr:hypothetical protein [Phycisphaerae bacterium]
MADAKDLTERVASLESRLQQLEETIVFMQHTQDQLNSELTRVATQTDRIEPKLGELHGALQEIEDRTKPNASNDEAVDHRPPHWDGRSR